MVQYYMQRFFLFLLLTFSSATWAHGHYHHHGHWQRQNNSWGWVAPVIIGGAIGYELARPVPPVIVTQQPPVLIQQQQNCSPWTQIQNPDGTVTTTRTCYGSY